MSEVNSESSAVVETAAVESSEQEAASLQAESEVQESGQEAAVAEQQIQALKKKFKLKVDGEEFEEELDLNDEEAVKRHLQLSKAAQKRMQEAAKQKQQAEKFFRMLKEDPISVLSDPSIGVDFRNLAEQFLAKQLEEEMLTPEQKRLQQAEQIIREREEEVRRQREEVEQQQITRLQEAYSQEYDKKITEALSSSGLPKTPKTVRRMAELMSKNLENGLELEPKDLVQLVREDYLSEIKELFGQTDGDGLLSLLGDDIANKIRKSDLARLRTTKPQPKVVQPSQSADVPKKPMSRDEWREYMNKRVSG